MDLESLVTDTLAGDYAEQSHEFSPLPPLQALEQSPRITNDELRDMMSRLPGRIEKKPESAPYFVAQVLCYLNRSQIGYMYHRNVMFISSVAATHAYSPRKKHLRTIERWLQDIEKALAAKEREQVVQGVIGNWSAQLDFLSAIFGEDLADELAFIAGVKKATARRWIKGGSTYWGNSRKVALAAKIFYGLETEADIRNEEARKWFCEGSPSPRDLLRQTSYGMNPDLEQKLSKLGIKL